MSKVDGVLEECGSLGKYQIVQTILASFCSFNCAFPFIMLVFVNTIPEHRCVLPSYGQNDTYHAMDGYHNQSILQYITPDKECSVNTYNNTGFLTGHKECNSFVYSRKSYTGKTITEEFDLVCSRKYLNTVSKISFTLGLVFGAGIIGVISDILGRRRTILGSLFVANACGIAMMFSVNIYMYIALRVVVGFCFVGCLVAMHVLILEMTGPRKRTVSMTIKSFFWPSGVMVLSLFSYFIRDWNWLQLATTIPAWIILVMNFFLLKESPHWLIAKGRHNEAVDLFHHIAAVNGKNIPENILERLQEDEEKATSEKLSAIFKAPTLLKRVIIFFYMWLIAGLGYYGLAFNVGNLTGDVYINNFLSGAVDIPSNFLMYASKWTGRKKPFIVCLFLGAASLIGCAFMYIFLDLKVYGVAVVVVAMVGKFAIAVIFGFDYFWCSEMFPSTLRTSLVGVCSLFARIGSIAAPVIVDLNQYVETPFKQGLGALIFGITMFIGGWAALALPETNNKRVPETIAEANVFMTPGHMQEYDIDSDSQDMETDIKLSDLGEVNGAMDAKLNDEKN